MKLVAAVLCRLCGRTAAPLRTKTGNDQNGDPSYFREKLPAARAKQEFHLYARQYDPEPNRNPRWTSWIQSGLKETSLHNGALCGEQWRIKPRESLLLLVTWRTHSHLQQRAERGVQMECFKERIWFDCSEQKCFCFMRCESRIVGKSLNCRKSRSVMTRWREKEVRARRGMWGRRQQEKRKTEKWRRAQKWMKERKRVGRPGGRLRFLPETFCFCRSVSLHSFPVTCRVLFK